MTKSTKIITITASLFFIFSLGLCQQETLTITTYYPSPYGSYRELRAQRVAIGTTYYDRATVCWDPPCPVGSVNVSASDLSLVVERNVAIGTTEQQGIVHIVNDGESGPAGWRQLVLSKYVNNVDTSNIIFRKARGSAAFPQNVQNGDALGRLHFGGRVAGNMVDNWAVIQVMVDGDPSATSHPSRIGFFTTPAGSTTPSSPGLVITNNGNVGIGTTSPNTVLDLNGAFSVRGMAVPALSPSGQGRIYFDQTRNRFRFSENSRAYQNVAGGLSVYTGYDTGNTTMCPGNSGNFTGNWVCQQFGKTCVTVSRNDARWCTDNIDCDGYGGPGNTEKPFRIYCR